MPVSGLMRRFRRRKSHRHLKLLFSRSNLRVQGISSPKNTQTPQPRLVVRSFRNKLKPLTCSRLPCISLCNQDSVIATKSTGFVLRREINSSILGSSDRAFFRRKLGCDPLMDLKLLFLFPIVALGIGMQL